MNLWLLCVAILFVGVEGWQWMSQLSWSAMVGVPQPWMVVAGVGLAIASMRSTRRLDALPPQSPTPLPANQAPANQTSANQAPANQTPEFPLPPPNQPTQVGASSPVPRRRRSTPKPSASSSISFEIRRDP